MYNHKVVSKLYCKNIKFNNANRKLQVLDAKGVDVLSGNLGLSIPTTKAFLCRGESVNEDTHMCWEWNNIAKFHLRIDDKFQGVKDPLKESPTARCYNFHWESLNENFKPTDCFNIGNERGQWYGGGLTQQADWQLEHGSFNFTPFITGDIRYHQWGNAVRRYFINSMGVAIEVDESTPLHISINGEHNSQLCLRAQYESFAFVNGPTTLPNLKYRICTASDMKILHHNLTQKHLWDGLKEKDVNVIKTMFNEPVWEVSDNLTDVSISNFTDAVIALGYFRLGMYTLC
jgi:myogenesis-regulating glycosidase